MPSRSFPLPATARLAAIAARLNRNSPLPTLWLFTDPDRLPDPLAAANAMPRGSGVIYRHFGAPDRLEVARRLRAVCRRRGLTFLIGADVSLAQQVRASGVHVPERLASRRQYRARGLITAAAHSRDAAVRARCAGAKAVFLSPVFPSQSPSAVKCLGARKAAAIARTVLCPVFALGGVNPKSARQLQRPGFSGLAAIEALKKA